jgi:alpha-glucosidase
MQRFTQGDRRLNTAYGFNFLYAKALTPALVRDVLERWPDTPGMGWPSWAFENHDAPRAVSRWAPPGHEAAFARMKMLLLMALRGNIFLYQGEELGLTQVDIPFDRLRDPEAIANWPLTLGRDGARTPMPWAAGEAGQGFSTAEPWLPFGPDHAALAVDRQERDEASMLALTRRLLAMRKANEALRTGAIRFIEASETLLAFERESDGQRLLCMFNFAADAREWASEDTDSWGVIEQVGEVARWRLGPFAGLIAKWSA